MSIEGIWTGEIHGPYGWENSGVYVLEQGLMLGGNNRHYSAGRYSLSGDDFEADVYSYYYGSPRTIFGEKRGRFRIRLIGTVDGEVIEAKVLRPDRPKFNVDCRFTRRMYLTERGTIVSCELKDSAPEDPLAEVSSMPSHTAEERQRYWDPKATSDSHRNTRW